MEHNFRIRETKTIYLDDKQFTTEAFDKAFKFDNFIIAYNCDGLVIVNCNEGVIFSKKGMVTQVYNDGQYIAIRDIHNYMGIIRYDCITVVPFNYYQTVIIENGNFLVRKTSDSYLERYDTSEK